MNDELERIWKEVVMAQFMILSQNLLGGTEETHERLQSWWPVSGLRF
jgi:hypothetical protein